MKIDKKLGIVIVSYGHGSEVVELVKSLLKQTKKDDRIVVVDNHPSREAYEKVSKISDATCITSENLGFSHGCNLGASSLVKAVDILVFINPDIILKDNVMAKLRDADYIKYAAITPRLLIPDGRINADGNVIHTTGLAWCRDIYKRPKDNNLSLVEVDAISGAFFALSTTWWKKLNGMDENYFMYYEDTDISSRITLLGGVQAVIYNANAIHDYEFIKGNYKWLYLERNRALYMLKNWPLLVIILLLPQNIISSLGLWFMAVIQKRLRIKIKATCQMIIALPTFIRARRLLQKERTISSYEFLLHLEPTIDNITIGSLLNSKLINLFYVINYVIAKKLLKITANL